MKAVFLDRDGTIVEDMHYPKDPSQIRLLPEAIDGLKLMQKKGYTLFVVSNQSGVGRGIIHDSEFKAVHDRICELLKENEVEIAEFSYCFHHPDDHCKCRKPETGLVPREISGTPVNFSESFAVGDKQCDVQLGMNLGVKESFLVLTGKGEAESKKIKSDDVRIVKTLLEMAKELP